MVAPRAETIFTNRHNVVGIALFCPECNSSLRCETGKDHPHGQAPDLVGNAGPLGFIARCDACGFRVKMRGDRLPTVAMMSVE
jgi:hypothetical protein